MAAENLQPVQWTAAQLAAIEATGCELLVSAGAGSGKTAVLSQRCAQLVARAEPRCPVDGLLVVTFTEAASAEMRHRIHRALRQLLAQRPNDPWLREQAVLVDLAEVSTLDALCRRLLVRHAVRTGLDPDFQVLDDHAGSLLRQRVAERLLNELDADGHVLSQRFFDLRMQDGKGQHGRLQDILLHLHAFLATLPDEREWRQRIRAAYDQLPADRLTPHWHAERRALLRDSLDDVCALAREAFDGLHDSKAPEELIGPASQLYDALLSWQARLHNATTAGDLDSVCAAMCSFTPPKKPTRNNNLYKKADAAGKAAFDDLTNAINEIQDALAARLTDVDARYSDAQWADGLHRVAPHAHTLLEITELFQQRYEHAKHEQNVLDYADLGRRTLDLLTQHRDVATTLQRHFHHVLVDEYQDINPLQDAILRLVARPGADGASRMNLFCVGDIKQSIYRFRHAEPELFARRHAELGAGGQAPYGRRIDLPENFRSEPPVLYAINALMQRLMSRELGGIDYDETACLRPPAGSGVSPAVADDHRSTDTHAAGRPAVVELHILHEPKVDGEAIETASTKQGDSEAEADRESDDWDRIEREANVLGRRLVELRAQTPGLMWRDMAIVMRAIGHRAAPLIRMLARLGIPAYAEKGGGLFTATEVQDVLSVLSLLDNSRLDVPMAALLRAPILRGCATIPSGDIPLSDEQLSLIRIHQPEGPYADAVFAYATNGPDAALRDVLAAVLDQVRQWRQFGRCHDVAETIARVMADTGYRDYVQVLSNGPQRVANLITLHEHARQFAASDQGGLPDFVRYLKDLDAGDHDMRAGAPLSSAADVVRIMTVHGSKGLEFPVVVLLEAGKQFNDSDSRGSIIVDRKLGLGMKAADTDLRVTWPTLGHRRCVQHIRNEGRSEEMRLLYVALTRAKQRIVVVGTVKGELPSRRPGNGLISLSRRHASRNVLTWMIDAVGTESTTPGFSVTVHTNVGAGENLRDATAPQSQPALKRVASLQPLMEVPAAATLAAQELMASLARPYPAVALTQVPSVIAVTELKRRLAALTDPENPSGMLPEARAVTGLFWRRPRFLSAQPEDSPTQRGAAVHLVLEHLDMRGACDRSDIAHQIQDMVERGLLSADDGALAHPDDIAWFFEQPLGHELRRHHDRVQRELTFTMAERPQRFDAAAIPHDADDFMVVRGIVDCVYETGEGLTIIDWKTDRLASQELDDRVKLYAGQLRLYAAAIGALLSRPVHACQLVFLNARRIVAV